MKIETINVENELERFFKYVVQQSRTNLTKGKTNGSKKLYNSLDYNIKENPNSISADFLMEDYGDFINYGVKGTESGRSLKGYKYTSKKPPVSAIKKWMKVKPVKARSRATGRFITQEQGAFAIQNAIYKRGIKPTEFFSKPFEKAFKTLPDELIEAYGLDVEDFMEFVLKE